MIISKTNFINMTRCPYYARLRIKNKDLNSDYTYEEYKIEQDREESRDISSFLDETYLDNTSPLLYYYKLVEKYSSVIAGKYFNSQFSYEDETLNQKKFYSIINDIKYLCYVDLCDKDRIIEVKATTTRKYKDLKINDKLAFVLENNILRINRDLNEEEKKALFSKLFNRFSNEGKYIYDIAVQRYFIENGNYGKYDYYLAMLNHDYVYDGNENYNMVNGEELIQFIDVNEITEKYLPIIDSLRRNMEKYLCSNDDSKVYLGDYCLKGKQNECEFFQDHCGADIPKENSIFSYLNCSKFKDDSGKTHKLIDLVNDGYLDMLDIPESWINSEKHFIQRDCYRTGKDYIDKEKIKYALDSIKYPIYHLDFETFPCPVPRFRGERPFSQSVFEFSLHVERLEGMCDFIEDNYVFLANSLGDEREKLVEELVSRIPSGATILAQNCNFEKSRIEELADIFPKYREKLLALTPNIIDLLWIINTKKDWYPFRSELPNYYSFKLSGSYSIKKTLPVFSNLSYKELDVHNGTEAVSVYANYYLYDEFMLRNAKRSLVEYCRQDTWAMVIILDAIRKL